MDMAKSDAFGLTDAEKDRLRLTSDRVSQIAKGLRDVAALPDPIGEVLEGSIRPNGLEVRKVRVPLGVVFFIYESRPNVTADAAAIAIKSGNAIILRGGKEAASSSAAIIDVLRGVAVDIGVPFDAVQLISMLDREVVGQLLKRSDCIDLVIPRGGESLIRRVVSEATMPVLKHYDGNCHVYVDRYANLDMAIRIIENAKCQRMGVCNAMESLVVHASVAEQFLPRLEKELSKYAIQFRGDKRCVDIMSTAIEATEQDWSQEYLGPVMSVRVVQSLEEAIDHINQYSSRHTEAIVTDRVDVAQKFTRAIDSSAVMVNASTRFNDGSQLGMGAEIGISTDKFHARGPCGLKELTTYKYIVQGNGHVRS
jgi:glutamate-5-semialdehyde dehydrogenase